MDDYVPDLVPSPDQKLIPGPIGRSKKGTLEHNSKIFGLKKSRRTGSHFISEKEHLYVTAASWH
jgi:hypothetical protein